MAATARAVTQTVTIFDGQRDKTYDISDLDWYDQNAMKDFAKDLTLNFFAQQQRAVGGGTFEPESYSSTISSLNQAQRELAQVASDYFFASVFSKAAREAQDKNLRTHPYESLRVTNKWNYPLMAGEQTLKEIKRILYCTGQKLIRRS